MQDRFYVDTRDYENTNELVLQWEAAERMRKKVKKYIASHGYKKDIKVYCMKYEGILIVSWVRSRMPNQDVFNGIKRLCEFNNCKCSDHLSDFIGED